MAQLENQQQQHVVHKTKSLICALNLVSRNLPLPPDLYDTVSSIYFDPEDAVVNASVDAAGGGVSEAKAVTRQGLVRILCDALLLFLSSGVISEEFLEIRVGFWLMGSGEITVSLGFVGELLVFYVGLWFALF